MQVTSRFPTAVRYLFYVLRSKFSLLPRVEPENRPILATVCDCLRLIVIKITTLHSVDAKWSLTIKTGDSRAGGLSKQHLHNYLFCSSKYIRQEDAKHRSHQQFSHSHLHRPLPQPHQSFPALWKGRANPPP